MIDAKPIVPVNPAGLDEVAKSLLEGDPDSPPFTSSVNANVRNPETYLIVPGKTHGNYSYPDLLVAMERTNLGSNWNHSHEALHYENAFMLSIRQYIDFLQLLKSGNVYDGRGAKLDNGKVNKILDEILEKRDPLRAEWLDAKFSQSGKITNFTYHKIKSDGTIEDVTEPLQKCLMEDAYVNLFNANSQGLPTKKSKSKETYYWYPKDKSVARFGANSITALLGGSWDPEGSYSLLGVRAARLK